MNTEKYDLSEVPVTVKINDDTPKETQNISKITAECNGNSIDYSQLGTGKFTINYKKPKTKIYLRNNKLVARTKWKHVITLEFCSHKMARKYFKSKLFKIDGKKMSLIKMILANPEILFRIWFNLKNTLIKNNVDSLELERIGLNLDKDNPFFVKSDITKFIIDVLKHQSILKENSNDKN